MKTLTLLALTSASLALSAQTTTHPAAAAHHTAAAPAHAAAPAGGGCITAPTYSPKIPALPATAPCVKALFTVTRTPETTLDYASPLLSPELHEAMDARKETFSLLYTETKPGTGELAKRGAFLTLHYTGWLVDGTKFDSSYDHPGAEPFTIQYGVQRLIAGWSTGFEGMRVGGKRRLYIPYQLAYGEAGNPGGIPKRAMLIFDVELLSQSDKAPEPKAPPAPATPPPAAATKPADTSKPADAAKPATPPPATTPKL